MKRFKHQFISALVLSSLSLALPAKAIEFPSGETAFASPPALVSAITPTNERGIWGPTYYFTLTVPETAGVPVQAVKISQGTNQETIHFIGHESRAFQGTRQAQGTSIPLMSIGGPDLDPQETLVVFEQPIMPGSTATIALKAQRNPEFSGTYVLGMTAIPVGDNGRPQFLGYQQISIYGDL
ncbi:DUF2808 domain-containing protein [Candidatus Synechococcus calcipolaris G9]|uniref:DUF2808 domain-containing protein n=1 Tax=Candidatus Synechococcus calcipolaris G9 TaxID=1497997 RepID=A0ABT6EX16_9SYNE|nr:DUF2808 domain-containing protein [Candidatus Synechococcus calcipolaris]MDG2989781.1 DUF2808 domain-containing protein [Candidatus Synechococcus calcipolaris G9]